MKTLETMLGVINPAVLPALRIAGALFLIINLSAGAFIFRNRHRFFDRDPNVYGDTEVTSHARVQVVCIPWLALTALLVVEWLRLWTN